MRVLACRVKGKTIGTRIELAERCTRFNRIRNKAVVDDIDCRHMLRHRKCRVRGRLVADLPFKGGVARRLVVHAYGCGLRLAGLCHRIQNLIVDGKRIAAIARRFLGFGNHDRDRIAHIAHFALGKAGMRGRDHGAAVL